MRAKKENKRTPRFREYDRSHCDQVGTHDEATNYPSVRVLRNTFSEETAAKWKDMHKGLQSRSVHTDNGGEFDGHFHDSLKSSS